MGFPGASFLDLRVQNYYYYLGMKAVKLFKKLLFGAGSVFLGGGAGFLAAPGTGRSYLELQQQSDAAHRFFLVAEPVSALVFLLSAMLAYIFTEFTWPRRIFLALWLGALCFGSALLVYIARFESSIEQKGREGQWKVFDLPQEVRFDESMTLEEQNGPGLALVAMGGELVLDRRSIFLRADDGTVRWHRKRPGSWPATVLQAGEHFFLALPSDLYPDDLQLFMFETRSGRLLWEFHLLGRKARVLAACSGRLILVASRPGLDAFYEIDVTLARINERRFFPESSKLPALCTAEPS